MGKQKQASTEPEGDQTGNQLPDPQPPKDEKAGHRDLVKSVLAELAESGEIFGAQGADRGMHEKANPDDMDLEGAIARVLERRDAESKAREKEQEHEATLTDLKEKVGKGLGRVRRWFEPASPWGD